MLMKYTFAGITENVSLLHHVHHI